MEALGENEQYSPEHTHTHTNTSSVVHKSGLSTNHLYIYILPIYLSTIIYHLPVICDPLIIYH